MTDEAKRCLYANQLDLVLAHMRRIRVRISQLKKSMDSDNEDMIYRLQVDLFQLENCERRLRRRLAK